MLVFTDEWLNDVKRRYERQPEYQKPLLYHYAINKQNDNMRQEIEEWVSELPAGSQIIVIPKLRAPEHFIHTYHELAVGSALRKLGYSIEYEKRINGLTPDWFVHPKERTPAFIVEVFTSNLSKDATAEDRMKSDLLGRIHQIPVGVALGVTLPQQITLDQKLNKAITERLQSWLEAGDPPEGARLTLDGVTFEVIKRNATCRNVQYGASTGFFWVSPQSLRCNIEEKISHYKRLASETGLPLIVGAVADPKTGLGLDDLADVLIGQETVEIVFEKATGKILEQRPNRKSGGLFHGGESGVSAVVWAWKNIDWKLKAIHNPSAALKLPESTFERSAA